MAQIGATSVGTGHGIWEDSRESSDVLFCLMVAVSECMAVDVTLAGAMLGDHFTRARETESHSADTLLLEFEIVGLLT